jgi:hypothetical protein
MLKTLAHAAAPVLELPLVRQVRRNHALEHATITILATRVQGLRMSGRSTNSGFILYGEAPTDKIEAAAREALRRLKAGQHELALHPNCGTNYVTTAVMGTLAAAVTLYGSNRRNLSDRLPFTMLAMLGVSLFGQPVGMLMQEHFTTDSSMGDLELVSVVTRSERLFGLGEPIPTHIVTTSGGAA